MLHAHQKCRHSQRIYVRKIRGKMSQLFKNLFFVFVFYCSCKKNQHFFLTWTEIRNLYIWFGYNVNRFILFSANLWPKGFSKRGCQKKKSRKLCFKSKRKSWKSVSNCFRNLEIYWDVWNTSKPLKDFFFIKIGFIFLMLKACTHQIVV